MVRIILIGLFCLVSLLGFSQTIINGKVTDEKGEVIVGANVFLEGTYDGVTTDFDGNFTFTTTDEGVQTLSISYISYDTFKLIVDISKMTDLIIKLKEDVNSLDTVVIAAGTFKAGDNSKVTALKPLDVVTTASALGDPIGAFQTLPGTSTVSEDGRLFVRGGDADETQIFIDDMRVHTPYSPTPNNTPTRGRFSPFLFDGMTFSTGGYSAEYGQALSSVLLLNTVNEPTQEKTDIGIMTVGASLGNTQIWGDKSLSINASYINLAPYNGLFPDRNDWKKPYEGISGEAVYRKKYENGILKLYSAFSSSNFEVTQEDINYSEGVHFKLKNSNAYFNGSYRGVLDDNWSVFSGLSYTHAKNSIKVIDSDIIDTENSAHLKLKFKRHFSNRFKLNFGAEYFITDFNENYSDTNIAAIDYGFKNNISAFYTEADMFFSKKLAMKAGVRGEYSELLKDFSIAPRVSLAYKTANNSQVSLAYGDFYQNPTSTILKFNQDLKPQSTQHYILNYQYNKEGKIFRAETYYKKYNNLVKYDADFASFDTNYNNKGFGYAKGLDLFWRDNKSIKNIDYWVSYSYLDTKRDYKNYQNQAQPNFVNKHNLSVVGKYWIEDWKSQVGLSYTFASGRPYTNPNEVGFLNQKAKPYNSLSLNWAYLLSPQKILYLSVNNALGSKNINGYQYANTPNMNGDFDRRALRPAADSFFFIGFFWTISDNKTDNQLDNL
ncbi:MAG: TonB-dependent receptor [Flavobacteriaceae bacterium]|nr:TonB-dependent receptor [Flavobacteriaceae bacterium]